MDSSRQTSGISVGLQNERTRFRLVGAVHAVLGQARVLMARRVGDYEETGKAKSDTG